MRPRPSQPSQMSKMQTRALELLPELEADDQRVFLKKFKTESALQAAHSTRELLLGAFLRRSGFTPRHEVEFGGKTPDWALYDDDSRLTGLVDQFTLHQVRELDDEINASLRQRNPWVGWVPGNTQRIYEKINEKASRYSALSESMAIAYVVSVFFELNVAVDDHEVHNALEKLHGGGVFSACPNLSGLLVSSERWGKYIFRYIPNPQALRPLALNDAEV